MDAPPTPNDVSLHILCIVSCGSYRIRAQWRVDNENVRNRETIHVLEACGLHGREDCCVSVRHLGSLRQSMSVILAGEIASNGSWG